MKTNLSLISIFLYFISCSTPAPYTSNYPLTKELFYSRTGEFQGHVPVGWFVPSLDTLPSGYRVWLLKDDYSATFFIHELYVDPIAQKEIRENGLTLLAQISITFNNVNGINTNTEAEPIEFEINGRKYCGYEIVDTYEVRRVVVFSVNGKYYECVTKPTKGKLDKEELNNLFSVQQAILASITFK